jgi:Flp pilus assembly protein TadD
VTLLALLSACGPRAAPVDTDADGAPTRALYDVRELLDARRPADAVQAAEALVASHPESWQAARALQDAHRAALAPPEFAALYVGAVRERPDDARAWYLRGRALIEDPAGARDAFERAASLAPTSPWPTIGLAYLHYVRGDLFSAVELYELTIRRVPHSRALRLAAANQYIELRLFVKAERHAGVAMLLAPEDPEVQAALGKAQLGLGNDEGALRWLESAVAAEPRLGDAWPMLAEIYLRSRRSADADAAYRTGLRLGQAEDRELAMAIRVARLTDAAN